jgi:hypothetical protein
MDISLSSLYLVSCLRFLFYFKNFTSFGKQVRVLCLVILGHLGNQEFVSRMSFSLLTLKIGDYFDDCMQVLISCRIAYILCGARNVP